MSNFQEHLRNLGDALQNDQNSTQIQIGDVTFNLNVVWLVLFSIGLVEAFIGNLLVLCLILFTRKLWTVTNVFRFNLTIGDLLFGVVVIPPNLVVLMEGAYYEIDGNKLLCRGMNCAFIVWMTGTVFTLLAMSQERYIAAIRTHRYSMTSLQVALLIIVIWLLAFIVGTPSAIEISAYRLFVVGKYDDVCRTDDIDESTNAGPSWFSFANGIFVFVMAYTIPMIWTLVNYINIALYRHVGPRRRLDDVEEQNGYMEDAPTHYKVENKTTASCIWVTLLHGPCWLPYFAAFLIKIVSARNLIPSDFPIHLVLIALSIFSVSYKKYVYMLCDRNFRVVCMRCCGCGDGRDTLTYPEHYNTTTEPPPSLPDRPDSREAKISTVTSSASNDVIMVKPEKKKKKRKKKKRRKSGNNSVAPPMQANLWWH